MTRIGIKYRDPRDNLRNGYLQAIVTINEHVKTLATIPPRNHLKQQDFSGLANYAFPTHEMLF